MKYASLIRLFFSALLVCQSVSYCADPFEINRRLGRGVNLGNALEAPKEGQWGVVLEERHFELIKSAGFDSVRLPIRWSAHAAENPPYAIDPNFIARVDWAVSCAAKNNLAIVVNMHHYEQLAADPAACARRFSALWSQIAEHFKNAPETVLFELLNEPCDKLDAACWNNLSQKALDAIRQSNPDRIVIIGPVQWNQIQKLSELDLPENDRRLIVTIHYYQPFHFTHQGASWVGQQSEKWLGTTWEGTAEQKMQIEADFDIALAWGKEHNRPIYLGEFGAYEKADMQSRARWAAFVRMQAQKRDFSWAWWEFCAGFGLYDRSEGQWNQPLIKALLPTPAYGK